MNKKVLTLIIFLYVFSICACSITEERTVSTIQARVKNGIDDGVKTKIAGFTEVPTFTPYQTYTLYPTNTPQPTLTAEIILITATMTKTPSKAPESEFMNIIIDLVEEQGDIEQVNLVRGENGNLVIEFFTIWASRDRQSLFHTM